jgi:hypothetical protein
MTRRAALLTALLSLVFALGLAAPARAAVRTGTLRPVPAGPTSFRPRPGVNAVLGDESYVDRFGAAPAPGTNETLRLATHLRYVEALLRARDVRALPPALRAERARNLDRLHAYIAAGIFPQNHTYPGRRPHFIDEAGRICAVGYLVEQSAGRAAAEALNREFEWSYVAEMHGEAVERWIARSGLTRDELAMIQPAYDRMPPPITEPVVRPEPPQPGWTDEQVEAQLGQLDAPVRSCLRATRRPRAVQVGVVVFPNARVSVSLLGADERGGARAPLASSEPAVARCVEATVQTAFARVVRPFAGRPAHGTRVFEPAESSAAPDASAAGPDAQRFRAALNAQMGRVAACLPPPPRGHAAGVEVQFHAVAQPDGSLAEVRIEAPSFAGDATILSCLSSVVTSVHLAGQRPRPVPVSFLLRLAR